VLVIRPVERKLQLKLMFALRVLLGHIGGCLLERGTGASYLTAAELQHLDVPVGLADKYKTFFAQYCRAFRNKHFEDMLVVETRVRALIQAVPKPRDSSP
jgi:hypothetical protein